jgi:hypothetical protein
MNAYRYFNGKGLVNPLFVRPTRKLENHTLGRILRGIDSEDESWMELGHDYFQLRTSVLAVLKLRVLLSKCYIVVRIQRMKFGQIAIYVSKTQNV